MKYIYGQEEPTLKERIDNEFYIDNYGTIIKVKPSRKHKKSELMDYVSFHFLIAEQCGYDSTAPEKMGWIKVGSVASRNLPITEKEPTDAQFRTLNRLGFSAIKIQDTIKQL